MFLNTPILGNGKCHCVVYGLSIILLLKFLAGLRSLSDGEPYETGQASHLDASSGQSSVHDDCSNGDRPPAELGPRGVQLVDSPAPVQSSGSGTTTSNLI
jgi:hypothetical protein